MVMVTSLWSLHKAIYERLSEDDKIAQKVVDFADKNTEYPYIVVGEPTVLPFDTKTSYGEEITLVLHVFSQYQGKKEAYEILNLILQSLSKSWLPLEDGSKVIDFDRDQIQVIEDIDNTIKHGILTLHYWINN